ncbi:MAG: phosphonate metabolism transcriptional regulator PhnF [Pseudomonadota bacterium]
MRNSPRKTPVWKAIAEALRSDLAEGRYRPGDKLPTEAALAARFGVNRHTVRHGVSALVKDGLVRTRRGSGAFVALTPTDYPIGKRVRFHENLTAAGRKPEKRILQLEARAATKGEAAALQIRAGDPVCAYHGLSLADQLPIAVFESIFPTTRVPDMMDALAETSSVTAALKIAGVSDYTRASTRISAVLATTTQALHLHIDEGDALIKSTGVNVDATLGPVEYGRTWFAGSRVTLTMGTEPDPPLD